MQNLGHLKSFYFILLCIQLGQMVCQISPNFVTLAYMPWCKDSTDLLYQRINGPVNNHLTSGPTISTKTSFAKFDIVLKWVKVNPGSSFI